MALSKEARDALPAHKFAVPGKRKLPIHDPTHIRLAWDMVDRTSGLTPVERKSAREHILREAKEHKMDVTDWHVHAELDPDAELYFEAMAIAVPEVEGHPNRRPFKGILTRVDRASDEPPGGSTGKRVLIPSSVAEEALPSLLLMAVDTDPDGSFDGHNPQCKIGLITGAQIEGDALHIEGFFYANDFPEIWERIHAEKEKLGFSYEVKVRIQDMNAPIWVVDSCVFTGAALLYKAKAAYHTTSLAAKAAGESTMNPEEIKKAIAEGIAAAVAPLQATVTAQSEELKKLKAGKGASLAGPIIDQVEPHIAACNACADAMEAKGIGTHPTRGHAVAMRRIGAHLLHAATMGHIPHIYNDHSYFDHGMEAAVDPKVKEALDKAAADLKAATDKVASLETKVADLTAAAARVATTETVPARKTLTANGKTLLDKFGIKEGEVTLSNVDQVLSAAGLSVQKRIEAKLALQREGLLSVA